MRPPLRKVAYYSLIVAICLGTFLGMYFAFIHVPQSEIEKTRRQATEQAKEEKVATALNLKEPEIKHLVDGKVKWRVKAGEVSSEPETGKTVFKETEGEVFGDDDRIIHFKAPLTIYESESGKVRIQGNFSGSIGRDALTIQGRDLAWNEKPDTLSALKPRVGFPKGSIQSDRLKIFTKKKKLDFRGNVRIRVPIKNLKKSETEQ